MTETSISEAIGTKVYPIELMEGKGYVHDIRFRCNGERISMRNLPTNEEREHIDRFLHKADNLSKCIIALIVAVILGGIFGIAQLVAHILHDIPGWLIGAVLVFIIACYLMAVNAEAIGMRLMLKKLMNSGDINAIRVIDRFLKACAKTDDQTWLIKFRDQLYELNRLSEAIWTYLHRQSKGNVIKAYFEAMASDKKPNAKIRYEYIDENGDVRTERIDMSVTVTENMNLHEKQNVLDFIDMTFRMGRKKIPQDHWTHMKDNLFNEGYEAIRDFLGYDYNPEEGKDATENRLDQAYDQMPDEEYQKFFDKYIMDAQ